MNTGMIPIELIERIEDYERRTDFSRAIATIGEEGANDMVEVIGDRAKTLNTVALIIAGALVCVLVVGILDAGGQAGTAMRAR
jgi:hypothetical protein